MVDWLLKNDNKKTNAFVTWTDGPIPVGRMHLNSMAKLLKVGGEVNKTLVNPSLSDLDMDSDCEDETSGNNLEN